MNAWKITGTSVVMHCCLLCSCEVYPPPKTAVLNLPKCGNLLIQFMLWRSPTTIKLFS